MKNIHVLPTDKPSRLYKTGNFLLLDSKAMPNNTLETKNQHIYITSDEKIKEGDWLYHRASNKLFKYDGQGLCVEVEKIILTTDQELIKDGVQPIDNEFLEWFVKNPSCEEVEVEIEPMFPMYSTFIESIDNPPFYGNLKRKIIIPKEEPKPEYSKIREGLKKSIEGKEHFIHHFKNGGTVEDFKPLEEAKQRAKNYMSLKGALEPKDVVVGYKTSLVDAQMLDKIGLEEPKQETLEEVAEKILFYNTEELEIRYRGGKEKIIKSMIDMAKWQQKRSYSDEEVIELLQKALTHKDNGETGNLITAQGEIRTANFYSWFEQNKKK